MFSLETLGGKDCFGFGGSLLVQVCGLGA